MPQVANISDNPGPLTQAQRTARTRRRLLKASLELVAQRGYQQTSLAAIGARAGYSRGVVSACFGSKSALLGALAEHMFGRWHQASMQPAVGELVGVDALEAVIDAVGNQARNAPAELKAFYLLLFEALGPLPELQPRFAKLHMTTRTSIAQRIRAGIEAGQVRGDVDADAQAGLFLGAFRGVMYQWLLDPEQVDLDRLLEAQKANIRIILSAPGASR